jgi:AAA15 family ATPase/GTPase
MIASRKQEIQGYQMITSLDVKNFRCFEHLKLSNLKRINIIVGANGTGKTALLEAIFLASGGTPTISFSLRSWRGLGEQVRLTNDLSSHHEIWTDLFKNFDDKKPITIEFEGSDPMKRELTIAFLKGQSVTIPINGRITEPVAPISFRWKKGKKILGDTTARVESGGLKIEGSAPILNAQYFATAGNYNSESVAEMFSELRKIKKSEEVVTVIAAMFDQVENVSYENFQGKPMLYAEVKSLPQLIPLGLVSSGITKLTAILTSIVKQTKGVVLIDEIENGFYYDTMPEIWKHILEFAEKNETQIFASTHSIESLRSLLPAMEGNEDKFCLLKALNKDGQNTFIEIGGKFFEASLEGNVEIRK